MVRVFCRVEDCIAEAKRDGLCWGHAKQMHRLGRVGEKHAGHGARYATPFARMVEACIALADARADDERAFLRARWRLYHAARRWVGR